jgi:hypothetical protein
MGTLKLAPGEETRALPAGARDTGRGRVELAPRDTGRKGLRRARPSRPRPCQAVAVPETAGDVGSGGTRRGSDGIGAGGSRKMDGRRWEDREGVTGPSPISAVVTKNVRSPRFRPSSSTATDALHELTVPWHGQLVQRDWDLHLGPGKRLGASGSVTFPASSSWTHRSAPCHGEKPSL